MVTFLVKYVPPFLVGVLAVLLWNCHARADTVVTVTVTQSQSSSGGGSVSRPVCDWTYPSSCYVPRTVIVQRPYRKRK